MSFLSPLYVALSRKCMHHVGVQQAEEHAVGYAAQSAGEWRAQPAERHGGEESTRGHNVQIPGCGPGRPAGQRRAGEG